MTRKKQPKVDAQVIFVNALGFHHAAQVIDANRSHKALLIWPCIVNEAFALELFLKALHRIRRRIIVREHNVKALFDKLSLADQKQISGNLMRIIVRHPNYDAAIRTGILLDANSIVSRAQTLFVHGRYWHEQHANKNQQISKDETGFAGNMGIGSLSDAIRDHVFTLRPEWRRTSMRLNLKAL